MTTPISLYYYQRDAVKAVFKYIKKNKKGNCVVELPTGAGKSYTLSECIRIAAGDLRGRCLVVTHSKKLVQQNYNSACKLWPEGKPLFGINSDGLGRRDYKNKVIFCGIQSVYNKVDDLCIRENDSGEDDIEKINFLIIDEAQRVNLTTSIQYKKFIKDLLKINPKMRVFGLSAKHYSERVQD